MVISGLLRVLTVVATIVHLLRTSFRSMYYAGCNHGAEQLHPWVSASSPGISLPGPLQLGGLLSEARARKILGSCGVPVAGQRNPIPGHPGWQYWPSCARLAKKLPEKPAAYHLGLLASDFGLLWGIVAGVVFGCLAAFQVALDARAHGSIPRTRPRKTKTAPTPRPSGETSPAAEVFVDCKPRSSYLRLKRTQAFGKLKLTRLLIALRSWV